jgi:PqqD family protein of HPr-rel-A system
VTAPRYVVPTPDEVRIETLDDLTLIYHRPSGQTHMVTSPVPEILALFAQGADLDPQAVLDGLARHYDLEAEGATLTEGIADQLAELSSLGLLRPA